MILGQWSSCILLKYSMILIRPVLDCIKCLYLVIAPVSCISRELSHYSGLIQVTARYRPDIFGCVCNVSYRCWRSHHHYLDVFMVVAECTGNQNLWLFWKGCTLSIIGLVRFLLSILCVIILALLGIHYSWSLTTYESSLTVRWYSKVIAPNLELV